MELINVGNILRNMRNINTKLSQKEIGEKLSVADNTISSYERGNSQPDFKTIVNYAKVCEFEIKIYNKRTKKLISIEEMSKEM